VKYTLTPHLDIILVSSRASYTTSLRLFLEESHSSAQNVFSLFLRPLHGVFFFKVQFLCPWAQVNSAKYDVGDSTLLLEVQQLGLPKENAEALATCFREAKDSLQVTRVWCGISSYANTLLTSPSLCLQF
jgi:hypothetical protein